MATADIGTGECSIKPVNPAVPLATADLQAHLQTFAQLGITAGDGGRDVPQTVAGGLQYYGIST